MSFNLDVLDLNGEYELDAERSDTLEECLRLQGYSWFFRKLASKVSSYLGLRLVYTSDLFQQRYYSSVNEKINEVSLKTPGVPFSYQDPDLGPVSITAEWEDNGKVLSISTVSQGKFSRQVCWYLSDHPQDTKRKTAICEMQVAT